MRMLSVAFLAALSLSAVTSARAADTPPPQVETWSLQQTGALGSAIFFQDRAAARATDALLAKFDGQTPPGLVGWVAIPQGEDYLVSFLVGDIAAPFSGYNVIVDKNGRASAVTDMLESALPEDHLTRFRARNTAAANYGPLRCAARYNAVVLNDPDSDGWLVWLLASTTNPTLVPMGGHYRYHVSPDGLTVDKREQLSGACLDMDRRQAQQGAQTLGLMTNVIVAPQPLEVHVFLSLLNNLPIFVMAGDRLWSVQGALIRQVDTSKQR